ncbi:protein kinase domain-containing protein [Pseudomonas viridiflava]|uniref:protein kinase domain-containing protein n=1 Tax=Pseudomonas viridiflava TaxID=33069 RepID=UPI002A6A4C7F|nr:protein kinase [Pseudomonas viridiflava]MDY0918845.1 protein kinase [Pseudomonas viridiflava]
MAFGYPQVTSLLGMEWMPALPQTTIDLLTLSLSVHLKGIKGYSEPIFIDSGGSAAIYSVIGPQGPRAFKVFDPKFLADKNNEAELRRLKLQKTLIGHDCPHIVKTYKVEFDEKCGTAFIEMELIDWPQLKKTLAEIPDESVPTIINQLVDAVKYLEERGIVHRDIKPENIHISLDFKKIKLLDLGVAREFDSDPDGAITDTHNTRPFIATAQYSSPEYLFRLDAPSKQLWHGLNIYQVGAVLHDILMKKQIFHEEIELQNRWLVARAVLSKYPSFHDENPARLSRYKSLSIKCLNKDLDSRIKTVSWDDFLLDENLDPLKKLRRTLTTSKISNSSDIVADSAAKLDFLRTQHWSRLNAEIRGLIQGVCQAELPSVIVPATTSVGVLKLSFTVTDETKLTIIISIHWMNEPQSTIALIKASAFINSLDNDPAPDSLNKSEIASISIGTNIHEDAKNISDAIATYLNQAIDILNTLTTLEAAIDLNNQSI